MHPVETYLRELALAQHHGVKETSLYPALKNLLDEIGKTIKPKVKCIIHIHASGAGIPDGGLFTTDQLRQDTDDPLDQLPARAVIEAKPVHSDAHMVAESEQVQKYLQRYGLVLVTTFREFVLIRKGSHGKGLYLEHFSLANDESSFWELTRHPQKTVEVLGNSFIEYLKRTLLADTTLAAPADVAWFTASYARDALARVENAPIPALAPVRDALQQTLGITFEGEKGEHFFRSTLVQTLFYGLFSAWVLWHNENPTRTDKFDWRTSAYYLRLPVIQALFEQLGDPSKVKALNLLEVLNWTGEMLNRVLRGDFFNAFESGKAIQYFYEPFLQAFDPALRKDLGVWYTPHEIVQYMVARVDEVLRSELGLADGLADPRVVVLDPAAGTGAYLVEVLKRIGQTLLDKGEGALAATEVKRAAIERVFGFEILPASYVVAHLQLGLLLQTMHVPLMDEERVGMYLTNSLTGWEPPKEPKNQLPMFPELAAERDAAEKIKRERKILVVMGNPPYNGFAGVSPVEEQGLVEPYKEGLISEWGIKKFNLDDLYVRFFRLAEKQITERTGTGIVCYITNFSYLHDPSFVVMRQRFLKEFDSLWFDSLNGDSRKTGKLTPEGKPDPSVFSTDTNKEGIRVGTAISLMVRKANRNTDPIVRFREFWGATKRIDLLTSLSDTTGYQLANPVITNRLSLQPSDVTQQYMLWPKLVDLCSNSPINGLMEKRGGALIDINVNALEQRMRIYFDKTKEWSDLPSDVGKLLEDAARFNARKARTKVLALENFDLGNLRRYALRSFDTRTCYYTPVRPIWNEPRPKLLAQCWKGNAFLVCRPTGVANPEGVPFYYTQLLGDNDLLRGHAYYFPLRVRQHNRDMKQAPLGILGSTVAANLSQNANRYMRSLGQHLSDADLSESVWMHALAVGYSPQYLAENADGIRQDWPRIPLPNTHEALFASASLGKQIAALLDTETPVEGVTTGKIRNDLRTIAIVTQTKPDSLNLEITAGWGHGGQGGITMPGRGRLIERPLESAELLAIPVSLHNGTTYDVYLNDTTYWKNIPMPVWEYVIGGYQVIKKWLSYREAKVLGRPITADEAREVRDMARRIAAIVLLQDDLNQNYTAVRANTYDWFGTAGATS